MNETLQTLFLSVLTAVVPVLATFIVVFIKKKTAELTLNINDKYLKDTIDKAIEIVADAVNTTTQTYVDSLKKDGKFGKEAQLIAFQKSKDAVMKLLSDETKQLIVDTYGDFDLWVKTKIESMVNKEK